MDRLRLPLRRGLEPLLEALDAGRGATRLVGGAVRDALVGRPFSDIDLATRLLPDEAVRRLKAADIRVVPTGLAHGTVTAVLPTGPVEVTTLRQDVSTDGRRATVAFTQDWRADAARRDFTINALYADPIDGTIFDWFGGLADLKAGVVRFIGAPLDRIAEDHLRILRFFRFTARYGRGEPDPQGLAACIARANDLMALSRERIADEVTKLLASADPVPTVRLMEETGIFRPVLPEIDAAGVARLERLVAAERAYGIPGDAVRRLGALLPADTGAAAAKRLRLSNARVERIRAMGAGEAPDPRPLAYAIGREAAIDRMLAAGRNPATLWGWTPPRLPIGGGALVAMGLAEGPGVARALKAIEARWIAEGFPPRARVMAIAEAEVAQRAGQSRANASSEDSGTP